MKDDVIIVGGGIVGLTLAALLSKNNFSVSIIEEKKFHFVENKLLSKPESDGMLSSGAAGVSLGDGCREYESVPSLGFRTTSNNLTARVSAIHLTAVKLLEHINVWAELEKNAAPLYEMKIWDHTQNAHLHFDSRDINELQMGFIVENRAMIKALYEKLINDKNVEFFCPHVPNDFTFEKNQLIIGADGANSWVRKQMPVNLKSRSYQQKAIIAVIESEKSHDNIAIQKFLKTGPVALLPLKNKHHTALVWSADNLISDDLMKKSDEIFSTELTNALDFKLGKLKNITERSQFLLTMQHADDYVSENYALVGDAAHTIHPLAGLGVNLGLMDAACLAQTLIDARGNKKKLTDLRVLRRYARSRKADNSAVICAMRVLQELFAIDTNTFNFVRSFGVNAIDQCSTIKNQLMEIAMGKSKDLPEFLISAIL